MTPNFSIFLVALPLVFSSLSVILRKKRFVSLLGIILSLICLLLIGKNYNLVDGNNVFAINLGGFVGQTGIEYSLDIFSLSMLGLVAMQFFIFQIFAFNKLPVEYNEKQYYKISCILFLLLASFSGLAFSSDIFNIYVMLEVSSLCLYCLTAVSNKNKSLIAAFRYLIIGTVAATLYLFGVGMVYLATGSLNLYHIANSYNNSYSQVFHCGIALMIIGLFIKAAIFPFSNWLKEVYANTSETLMSFIAATSSKLILAILAKIIFYCYYPFSNGYFSYVLLFFAILTIIYGTFFAIKETQYTAILAYSSIANNGFILALIAMLSPYGFFAAVFYIFSHSLAKSGLFMVKTVPKDKISNAMRILFLASLAGVPLTSGFIAKILLLDSLVVGYGLEIFIIMLIFSAVSLIYVFKLYQGRAFSDGNDHQHSTISSNFALLCLGFLNIVFGLVGGVLIADLESFIGSFL